MNNDLRAKLVRFYQKHKPEKESDVEKVLGLVDETGMTEHELFDALCKKYGVLYDPLEWKAPVIGKGTINGAAVELHEEPGSPKTTVRRDTASGLSASAAFAAATATPRVASGGCPVSGGYRSSAASSSASIQPSTPAPDRRQILEQFYKNYNPTKLSDIDMIIKLSEDSTDEEILTALCKKYNLNRKAVFKQLGVPLEEDDPSEISSRPNTSASHSQLRNQLQSARGRDEGEDVLRKEFAEWITRTMALNPPLTEKDLFPRLSDGTLLCRLLQVLNPKLRFNYSSKPINIWQKLENVKKFLELAEREFQVPKEQLFDPQDLVESDRDKRQVMTLFLFVAKASHQMFSIAAPQIVKLELEIEKEDEVEISNDEVEKLLEAQRKEKEKQGPSEEEVRRERERQKRLEEEEEARQEAERKARQEAYEREKRRKEEEIRRLQQEKRYAEERRLREEEARQQEQYRRRMAAEEEERRRRAAERQERMKAECIEEDNPVFQYKNNKYISDRRDALDVEVGRVVNSLPTRPLGVKLHKVKEGMYVIEYPKRIVFYVRCLRGTVMIRVGGGWSTLEEFLYRRLKEYPETYPINMIYDKAGTVAVLHHRNRFI
eukprot:TRINITY_DN3208_c0_g1_i1.p1 TRINITY_DN3208_c0_g1~~TRINITY_DN3208_c0_g1_i1.p1  ORF type:complete len:605 (+),score=213.75 TRINITY_DN3208_c0_g1_i1:110-1924(+)